MRVPPNEPKKPGRANGPCSIKPCNLRNEASVLDRILFATRYTRHLNQQGYLRFYD
jgi:hypothetical protein